MNHTEFTDHIQTVFNRATELIRNKNTRYSDDANAFSNLELCENAGGVFCRTRGYGQDVRQDGQDKQSSGRSIVAPRS